MKWDRFFHFIRYHLHSVLRYMDRSKGIPAFQTENIVLHRRVPRFLYKRTVSMHYLAHSPNPLLPDLGFFFVFFCTSAWARDFFIFIFFLQFLQSTSRKHLKGTYDIMTFGSHTFYKYFVIWKDPI